MRLVALAAAVVVAALAVVLALRRRGLESGGAGEVEEGGRVCVVVPAVPRHVRHLPDLLRSVEGQSLPPSRVVIALSETDEASCRALERALRSRFGGMGEKIELACTAAPAFAAANRNRGGAACGAGEIVSFMDADDVMRPGRLERVRDALARADAVVHSFGGEKEAAPPASGAPPPREWSPSEMRSVHSAQSARGGPIHLQMRAPLHHGHITVRSSVFEAERQDERPRFRRSEDSEYVRRLIERGYDLVFLERDLSLYRPHLSAAIGGGGEIKDGVR